MQRGPRDQGKEPLKVFQPQRNQWIKEEFIYMAVGFANFDFLKNVWSMNFQKVAK
jgi:hypothetical protein